MYMTDQILKIYTNNFELVPLIMTRREPNCFWCLSHDPLLAKETQVRFPP